MGRHLDLQHLSEEECEKILEVIQRDFNIRQNEKARLNKIEETVEKEKKTREILAEKAAFNENCCMRCCDTFSFFFNRKRVCIGCKYNICKNCCVYDDNVQDYVCSTCQKHRELVQKSCDWFYQDVKRRFRRFGSAKVVRSLFKRRPEYDEASDSGLGAQASAGKTNPDTDGSTDIDRTKTLHLERFDKQLNNITEKVHDMLQEKFADDKLKLRGMRPNHGLMQSYKKEISIDLTNLAQALFVAYENQPCGDQTTVNKLVQETLMKQVETIVGHPVSVTLPINEEEEDSSATDDDDDSICDDHPFEDQLADHIIAQILDSFKSSEENSAEASIGVKQNRPEVIVEECRESPIRITNAQENKNLDFDSDEEDCVGNSVHRSDSDRINPLLTPRNKHHKFFMQASPLPSFENIQSPLGKREIDPDDLVAIEQNSDDFENLPDYDDDDINYLERSTPVHDGNNWTFSLKDESGDKVENMAYQEWMRNIRRPKSASFPTKPIQNLVTATQNFGRVSPMIGNREVDELTDSSICSDDDDDQEEAEDEEMGSPNPGDVSMESKEIEEITKNMMPTLSPTVELSSERDIMKTEKAVEACTDPRFEMKPMDLSVPDGEHAQLRCRLIGTNPIDVFWYRENGKDIDQLEEDDKYEMTQDGNQYMITIYNTTPKDAGGYICIAVNGEGQCSCTTRLTLKENPLEKKPPQFLKQLEDVEVTEGQGVKFVVKVKGYPVPRVSWFRDGCRIKSNDEYQLQQFGNRGYILTIDHVTLDNDAEYSVIAQNCRGRIKCDAQLLVEPKPKALPQSQLNLPLTNSPRQKDKSATHLENLSEKVAMTRRRVSGTAEDVLASAKKISSLDEELDEMDRRLNNLEVEVSMPVEDDDNTTSSPGDGRKGEQEAMLGEYNAKKKAAGDIRLVTSTALDCLTRAERIIAAENDSQRSNTKRKSQPEVFTFCENIPNMNDLDKPDVKVTNRSPCSSTGDADSVLDFSPPKVDARRYSREYVISGDAEDRRRRKWEVAPSVLSSSSERRRSAIQQVVLADTEDEIYMAAGRVFSLEEKIKMLEAKVNLMDESTGDVDLGMMEDEVATAVAEVTQSERQVDNVEHQVGALKKMFSSESLQSQYSTHSEPDSLVDSGCGTGATTPTDLMSPRPSDIYQIEEDLVNLPSVRGLMTMFNCTAQVADSGTPLPRVHSLTGRDLPSSTVEKYRNKTPSSGQKGQPSEKGRAPPGGVPQKPPMSPLAIRSSSGIADRKGSPQICERGPFLPQAGSSPITRNQPSSQASKTPSSSYSVPKIKPPLVSNTSRASESNQSKIKQALVNRDSPRQNQPKYKPQLINPNRVYDPSSNEVITLANQPLKATESFSTLGSMSDATKSAGTGMKSAVKSDEESRLLKKQSSSNILTKAAFWDSRINDGIVSDRDVVVDDVFNTEEG